MARFPVLHLKSGRDRALKNRHPWIFSGAVKKRPEAKIGDTIEIKNPKGETLGFGHYAPDSQIICRVFHFGPDFPGTENDLWLNKFSSALKMRQTLLDQEATTGFRLLHAEGDNCPGLIVDIYGKVASVQLRTAGGMRQFEALKTFLLEEADMKSLYFQRDPKAKAPENLIPEASGWVGEPVEEEVFLENNMKFKVNVERGQKTGFFLDQRDNRSLLRQMAKGRRVLNCFSYTGGFSVAALSGGAEKVVSVDSSESAMNLCAENITLNFGEDAPHVPEAKDCFQYLKDLEKDAFDLIVLDPPAFSKHISTVKKASRGYKEINLKAFRKIQSGGLLFTFSCSQHISRDLFRKIVFGAAADAGRRVRILHHLSQGADHPVDIYHPEGEYLKGLVLWVED